jgi:transposase
MIPKKRKETRFRKMQEKLRKEVKLLKALQGISYNEIAGYLEIHRNSFYNWLKGYYDFSIEKEQRLIEILSLITD